MSPRAERSRFVVLRHEPASTAEAHSPGLHWDLMLERGGVLRTWRLPHELHPDRPMLACRLPDHRLAYLEYEGPLSQGRGSVRRADAGSVEWLAESDDRIEVRLASPGWQGRLSLMRQSAAGNEWLVTLVLAKTDSDSG